MADKRDQVLQLRLSVKERKLIDAVAEEQGFTRAQALRWLVMNQIKKMRDRGELSAELEDLLDS